jgi:transcriptional regulator with XRE-family HTH domain
MNKTSGRQLEVMRNKSGLSQRDIAHLLGIKQSRVSLIEKGGALPTLRQLCKLSLIFGKPPESLLESTITLSHKALAQRLPTLPRCCLRVGRLRNRQHTLNALAARLEMSDDV